MDKRKIIKSSSKLYFNPDRFVWKLHQLPKKWLRYEPAKHGLPRPGGPVLGLEFRIKAAEHSLRDFMERILDWIGHQRGQGTSDTYNVDFVTYV